MKKLLFVFGIFIVSISLTAQTQLAGDGKSGGSVGTGTINSTCSQSTNTPSDCYNCCEAKKDTALAAIEKWLNIQLKACERFSNEIEINNCKVRALDESLAAKKRVDSLYNDCINACKDKYTNGPFKTGEAFSGHIATLIYPSPATDELTFESQFEREGSVTVTFYNMMGAIVRQMTLDHNEGLVKQTIDLESLSNGIYLIDVREGDFKHQQKIVIAK